VSQAPGLHQRDRRETSIGAVSSLLMDVARIDPAPMLPAQVGELLGRLRAAGGRAWLVGGTVRDLLLGVVPRDYDIATDLVPAQVARVLPEADHRHADLGACRVPSANGPVAITSLRADGKYGDHRHPDSVRFVREPEVDAQRRDFTINALYLDVERNEIPGLHRGPARPGRTHAAYDRRPPAAFSGRRAASVARRALRRAVRPRDRGGDRGRDGRDGADAVGPVAGAHVRRAQRRVHEPGTRPRAATARRARPRRGSAARGRPRCAA
jgi:hypothetical protein